MAVKMRKLFWAIENLGWNIRCRYNLWLHGPYGLSKTVVKMPFRFVIKYLRKYGATIGSDCHFERGINIHRPLGKRPFDKLFIGNNVYLGHNTLIDLSREVEIRDDVIIASRCQIWTHASFYEHRAGKPRQYDEHYGKVVIDEGSIIYSNCVISHGIIIGKNAVVGANSLVNKSVEDGVFVGGVPAKLVRFPKNEHTN